MKNKIITMLLLGIFMVSMLSIVSATQSTVDLGTSGGFAILAKSGISTTGATVVTGHIGVSPIDSTAITGFSEALDSSGTFSTSIYVSGGKIYAADYAAPTPAFLTLAVGDMQTAYTDAAGRTSPDDTNLGSGTIGGMVFNSSASLHKWTTNVNIATNITINCTTNQVVIFQITGTLTTSPGSIVYLVGGCQAKNIYWQVSGATQLGTTSVFYGNILDYTSIAVQTGANVTGRLLAQTAVTLDANTITSTSIADSTGPSLSVKETTVSQYEPINYKCSDTNIDRFIVSHPNAAGTTVTDTLQKSTSDYVQIVTTGAGNYVFLCTDLGGNIATDTVTVTAPTGYAHPSAEAIPVGSENFLTKTVFSIGTFAVQMWMLLVAAGLAMWYFATKK